MVWATGHASKWAVSYSTDIGANDKEEHVFRSDDLGKSWVNIDIKQPYTNGWVYMCGDRQTY